MEQIHNIYDLIAKRCVSLSSRCTIHLINGLYGTDYSPDSSVTYNWTENTDDELHRTLADTIVTINSQSSYHIEFQMTRDGDTILRVLEYGFHHAMNTRNTLDTIYFPEPMIVYLYDRESFPDEYNLNIVFGSQGSFLYKVPVFKYLEKSMSELDARKLIVLIPFQLLRLRKAIEKERTKENMDALKKLITHDILESINQNVQAGNITHTEATKLGRMILRLYHHIYDKYTELEKEGVSQLAEDALIFDVDILEYQIKKLERETSQLESKKEALESEKQSLISQKQSLESEKQSLESEKQSLESEKQSLESEIQTLTALNHSLIRLLSASHSPAETASLVGISEEEVCAILQS